MEAEPQADGHGGHSGEHPASATHVYFHPEHDASHVEGPKSHLDNHLIPGGEHARKTLGEESEDGLAP